MTTPIRPLEAPSFPNALLRSIKNSLFNLLFWAFILIVVIVSQFLGSRDKRYIRPLIALKYLGPALALIITTAIIEACRRQSKHGDTTKLVIFMVHVIQEAKGAFQNIGSPIFLFGFSTCSPDLLYLGGALLIISLAGDIYMQMRGMPAAIALTQSRQTH
ncbi:hypothetical protein WJ972_00535 [Achromobacter insuavis]